MHRKHTYPNITPAELQTLTTRYPTHFSTDLNSLDEKRYTAIPAAVAERQRSANHDNTHPYITRDELIALTHWKLKHGTFRPRLLQLIESNTEEDVRRHSSRAFDVVVVVDDDDDHALGTARLAEGKKSLAQAFTHLTQLRGVGPATASLILSVALPADVPFFSDELYRWANFSDVALDSCGEQKDVCAPSPCWSRKVKYSMPEYWKMYARVDALRNERLKSEEGDGVSCVDLEKAVWVLCREDGIARESNVETEAVLKREAASGQRGKDPEKMKRVQRRPKRKSEQVDEVRNKRTRVPLDRSHM